MDLEEKHMVNEEKLDNLLLEMGHNDFNRGTAQIRIAVKIYTPGMSITRELYPGVAKATGSDPRRVERNMRHSIECAFDRCPMEVQLRYFGNSVHPAKGRPTVGEYITRIHRLVAE